MDRSKKSFSESDLEYLCFFIKENAGIHLTPKDYYLFEARLTKVIKNNKLTDFSNLVRNLRILREEKFVAEVVEAMTIHETSFFRGRHIFESLKNCIIEDFKENQKSDTIHIWSSATSSGEEAYTMAMLLKDSASILKNKTVQILATDLSQKIINKAKSGIYSAYDVERQVPEKFVSQYFARMENGAYSVAPAIKNMITFAQHNLVHSYSEHKNLYNLILCRNVLIYFDEKTKEKIINLLLKSLQPNGILVVGGTEILENMSANLKPIKNLEGAYRYTPSK